MRANEKDPAIDPMFICMGRILIIVNRSFAAMPALGEEIFLEIQKPGLGARDPENGIHYRG
jgi:hypothetical protein